MHPLLKIRSDGPATERSQDIIITAALTGLLSLVILYNVDSLTEWVNKTNVNACILSLINAVFKHLPAAWFLYGSSLVAIQAKPIRKCYQLSGNCHYEKHALAMLSNSQFESTVYPPLPELRMLVCRSLGGTSPPHYRTMAMPLVLLHRRNLLLSHEMDSDLNWNCRSYWRWQIQLLFSHIQVGWTTYPIFWSSSYGWMKLCTWHKSYKQHNTVSTMTQQRLEPNGVSIISDDQLFQSACSSPMIIT